MDIQKRKELWKKCDAVKRNLYHQRSLNTVKIRLIPKKLNKSRKNWFGYEKNSKMVIKIYFTYLYRVICNATVTYHATIT